MRCFYLYLLAGILVVMPVVADISPPPVQYEDRYYDLLKELRCLVCQNQALSDSNSELAGDLRTQVIELLKAGSTDDEIIDFMVARYGDFVIYKPRFKPSTYVLWAGPFVLFFTGLAILIYTIRRRGQTRDITLTPEERARLKELLKSKHGEDI